MGDRDEVLRRQSTRTKFKNSDMDFALNWTLGVSQVIGMAPGEVLATISTVRDGDPGSWRDSFSRQGDYLSHRANVFEREGNVRAAGHSAFGAAYARRFALHFEDPRTPVWDTKVAEMELEFARAAAFWDVPIRSIKVPFEHGVLPGYYVEVDASPRPTVLMIGGGDTFREDLFYYGGYPGWQRGYNMLMVHLPGQGATPATGFTFRHDSSAAIGACIDWLERHATSPDPRIVAYGLSGGGYFTAQAVAADPRICAWVASTPITNMALLFEREMGAMLRAPGWLLNALTKLVGRANAILDISLRKYAWQFGTADFAEVVARVQAEAPPVRPEAIARPSLFLLGDGEATELRRQTEELAAVMQRRGYDVTIRRFAREEGDAHCQVTNLALAHLVVFDWLDHQFKSNPSEPPA